LIIFLEGKIKTLLLDLDETLIHSCEEDENPEEILVLKSEFGEDKVC